MKNGRQPARSTKARTGLGLCMMVKNEAQIIGRALESAMPYVDATCVSDTGSTDATCALVECWFPRKRGLIWHDTWVNFGHNRTRAFAHARHLGTEYLLVMDADQTLVVEDPEVFGRLTLDAYNIQIRQADIVYPHPWVLKADRAWKWGGVTHEALLVPQDAAWGTLVGAHLVEHADSVRRMSGAKLLEDRALLAAAYEEDPTDPRTVFYLAQVCQDEGRLPCAIKHYKERVAMGGWAEETWCAQYRLGRCYEGCNQPAFALEAYLAAYQLDPSRAESLYRAGRVELMRGHPNAALVFFEHASLTPKPSDRLFLEPVVYDYAAAWGQAMALRLLGRHDEAQAIEDRMLEAPTTPPEVVEALLAQRASHALGRLPG